MKNIINKPVTDKQKEFARLIVEHSFGENSMSHSACAKKAGYAPESAGQRAYELTNPEICPNVCRYIEELKNEFRKKNKIDPDRHMGRLNHLGLQAEKNKMYIAYHAHKQASDHTWDIAMSQSPYNAINLDCGHYIAAGGKNTQQSLLNFIIKNNKKIMSMHIKDRSPNKKGKTDHPWGEGETPISEILKLLKEKQYKIPASIELEYTIPKNSNAVEEVKKCLNYAKNALST